MPVSPLDAKPHADKNCLLWDCNAWPGTGYVLNKYLENE